MIVCPVCGKETQQGKVTGMHYECLCAVTKEGRLGEFFTPVDAGHCKNPKCYHVFPRYKELARTMKQEWCSNVCYHRAFRTGEARESREPKNERPWWTEGIGPRVKLEDIPSPTAFDIRYGGEQINHYDTKL